MVMEEAVWGATDTDAAVDCVLGPTERLFSAVATFTILVGGRHLQPQENIYIQRNNCQESPNGGKITIFFFLELGPQRPFLVPEIILSQNIFLPTTQGPDIKKYFDPILQTKYILGGVTHQTYIVCDIGSENIFCKSVDL